MEIGTPIIEAFDYERVNQRNADASTLMIRILIMPRQLDAGGEMAGQFLGAAMQSMVDCASALSEVKRLLSEVRALRQRHLPKSAVANGGAICVACSAETGSPVSWECSVYSWATSLLPESER